MTASGEIFQTDPLRTTDDKGLLPVAAPAEQPQQIGRYRIEKVLGEGGFGRVYLAHDDQLKRPVAIKVPRPERLSQPGETEAYLAEARVLASLDHPNIVSVFDVGSTPDGLCYVVSKLIEGCDLAKQIQAARPSYASAAELTATVAEALDYAHHKGLVHRDIRPGNLLIDPAGKPYVADFGLALKEEDFGTGARFAGTPAYMSPEQARGEGHRVDGRSDIFSLGMVFYELLTGRRPFQGASTTDLLEQIIRAEVRPPRQIEATIPQELERIALKALAKRASERYATAKNMAEDLRHFLGSAAVEDEAVATRLPRPVSERTLLKIVPKGLRAFDAHDADFFLELLPGPRDREGLPDSLRFWKNRIEATEADNTFSVGLIYGPSGCGKSSLVKAGLLPRLANVVTVVYLEATTDDTEARLLKGLRRQVPELPGSLGLIEALATLRQGQLLASGRKVLLVLDQFEQWLHAQRQQENTELVQALRQCDGGRVQCLVLVRDDFWMAATRFLRELEIRLVEAQNAAAVDLFPLRHAERVLTAFGRAFGALPEADLWRPIDPSLQALVGRLEQLSDQYRELREGVHKAIQVAEVDPEMALTRSRKVLEYVIRDVYARRIQEAPDSRGLETLLRRLVKDGHFPDRLDAYANTIRRLGNVGTHVFGDKVTVADVHQSLNQLRPILEWYFEVERPEALAGKPATRPQLPPGAGGRSAAGMEHKEFLEQAVAGLAQDGKIICVRLALFAEMMKDKAWTPATLKEVGGTEGIGVTFLEERFSAATAPPEHRHHQQAARAVLQALLPESGTDLKGHMRAGQELLAVSGYRTRPQDFEDLLRILDSELRLITPTDPEGGAREEQQVGSPPALAGDAKPQAAGWQREGTDEKYYQLTHDYLVPSLREWLTRKQKETRRGRAALLLADRAGVWSTRPETRQLPSLWQWLSIRWLTPQKHWTAPQRKMMRQAGRYHAVRGLLVAGLLALVGLMGWEGFGRFKAQTLRDRLLEATTAEVPGVVQDMARYRRWVDPLLQEASSQAQEKNDARKQLHASLALVPVDSGQVEYLYGRLLQGGPQEVVVIREALRAHQHDLTPRLWRLLENRQNDPEQRLRASCALAAFAPDDPRWAKTGDDVAATLVVQQPFVLAQWTEALQGVGKWLLPTLADFLADEQRSFSDRGLIAHVYGTWAANRPEAYAWLEKGLVEQSPPAAAVTAKISLAKRQAGIGVALLVMDRGAKVWPLLKHRPDLTLRSFLIERLGPGGVSPRVLTSRLEEEPEASVKRAILLSLGEFGLDRLSQAERRTLTPRLLRLYRDDPDGGIHGAATWLLQQWQASAKLKEIDKELASGKVAGQRRWYVNGQGQTMMLVSRPGAFWMGEGKERRRRQIDRSFALASREVTVEEFLGFRPGHPFDQRYAPTRDCPVNMVSWYEAVEYCNWLNEQEGIPRVQWCYLPNPAGKYEAGMKMAPNYLHRTGYRLPTEAEWEYACRAGSDTGYSFGEADEILGKYAWYGTGMSSFGKSHPVGLLKPNDLGLCDVHGNVWKWTQDAYPQSVASESAEATGDTEDIEDMKRIDDAKSRVLRGGAFSWHASLVRSASRIRNGPRERFYFSGFRAARTLTP